METQKIKNAVNFYTVINQFKYIQFGETDQSYADHLYGSMILAVSMNSEFDLTHQLGKVLRMIALGDSSMLKKDIKDELSQLSKGNEYIEEINEYVSQQSDDAIFAHRCKELDYKLHEFIKRNIDKALSIDTLYQYAKRLGILSPVTDEEDDKFKEIFRFYYMNHQLKQKERSGWNKKHWNVNSSRLERISEHVYGTIILALVLNSECNFDVDIDKVIETLCIHEVGEILIDDITPFDGITTEEKERIEHEAVKKVIGNLQRHKELIQLVFDFDNQNTNDTRFAYYCDKLEVDIQSKIYQDMGLHHPLTEQENNVVMKSSKVQKMMEDGASTAFDIWYGYDKPIYQDSPILIKTLDYIKENKLK